MVEQCCSHLWCSFFIDKEDRIFFSCLIICFVCFDFGLKYALKKLLIANKKKNMSPLSFSWTHSRHLRKKTSKINSKCSVIHLPCVTYLCRWLSSTSTSKASGGLKRICSATRSLTSSTPRTSLMYVLQNEATLFLDSLTWDILWYL